MSELTHYQVMRSRNNTHLFVICYADRFYDDVPLAVRNRGPWAGDRGLVQNLRPEIRLTLRARATWWSRRRRLCSTPRRRAASKKDANSGGRWNRRPQRAIRGYKQRAAPVLLRPTAIQRRFRELSSSGCRSAGRKWPRRTGARGGQYSCASSLLQGLPPMRRPIGSICNLLPSPELISDFPNRRQLIPSPIRAARSLGDGSC